MGTLLLLASCGQGNTGELEGYAAPTPADFRFLGTTASCYLEVGSKRPRSIRVNCFHIDGNLHIHSNRFARFPRLRGESWVEVLRREPRARVSIAGNIYSVRATPIDDPADRETILHARGYWYLWDGITIFRFAER